MVLRLNHPAGLDNRVQGPVSRHGFLIQAVVILASPALGLAHQPRMITRQET
jgi:hypothetical protein